MSIFPPSPLGMALPMQQQQPQGILQALMQQQAPQPNVVQAPNFPQQTQGARSPFGGMNIGQIAKPFLMAMGTALAANNPAAGANVIPQYAQQNREQRKRNQTLEWMKQQPGMAQFVPAVESGAMTMAEAYKLATQPAKERKYEKAADGFKRYTDDGSRVFPDVEAKETNGISIGPDGQLVYNPPKQEAKNVANLIKDNRETAASASSLKQSIQTMRTALDSAGYMGPGAGFFGAIDDAAEAVGKDILPGNSQSRAVVQSGGMDFILRRVQDTKGAISNKEMDAFAAAGPGLTRTKEGNRVLLDIADKVADRQIMRVQAMEQWRVKNGGSLDGFEQTWAQYLEQNPIVTPEMFGGQAPAQQQGEMRDFQSMSDEELRALANGG